MTESFDVHAARFFEEQLESDNKALAMQDAAVLVLSELSLPGAPLDESRRDARIGNFLREQLNSYLSKGFDIEKAEDLAHLELKAYLNSEAIYISLLTTTLSVKRRAGFLPEDEERRKKELMAIFAVRGLDEGWSQAVDNLFEGEPLDLSKEVDIEIYTNVALQYVNSKITPFMEAASEILLRNFDLLTQEESLTFLDVVGVLKISVVRATRDPKTRINLESDLDGYVRQGLFTETQARELLEHIDSYSD